MLSSSLSLSNMAALVRWAMAYNRPNREVYMFTGKTRTTESLETSLWHCQRARTHAMTDSPGNMSLHIAWSTYWVMMAHLAEGSQKSGKKKCPSHSSSRAVNKLLSLKKSASIKIFGKATGNEHSLSCEWWQRNYQLRLSGDISRLLVLKKYDQLEENQDGLHEIKFSPLKNWIERESSKVSIGCFPTETEYFAAVNCSNMHMLNSRKEFSIHDKQCLQWHNLTNANSAGLQKGSWYEGKKTTSRNFPHCRQTRNDASTRGGKEGWHDMQACRGGAREMSPCLNVPFISRADML